MNIYYSFNDFMSKVMEKADSIALQNHNCGLDELFDVSRGTFISSLSLINAGWHVFLAVVALLFMSAFGFTAALVGFLTTPIGLIVVPLFGLTVGKKLKQMYDEKILPITVKEVGEQYKARWEAEHPNPAKIDRLLNQAANDLYQRALQGGVRAIIGN